MPIVHDTWPVFRVQNEYIQIELVAIIYGEARIFRNILLREIDWKPHLFGHFLYLEQIDESLLFVNLRRFHVVLLP